MLKNKQLCLIETASSLAVVFLFSTTVSLQSATLKNSAINLNDFYFDPYSFVAQISELQFELCPLNSFLDSIIAIAKVDLEAMPANVSKFSANTSAHVKWTASLFVMRRFVKIWVH